MFTRNKIPSIKCNHMEYPLMCNNEEYDRAIAYVKKAFADWIRMETTLATGNQLDISHPVIALSRIAIRPMPYNDFEGLFRLKSILSSVEFSGTNIQNRFVDTIQNISMVIPFEVQMAMMGKFLWAMTCSVVTDTDGQAVGDLEDWAYIIREYPWIPYLAIYQAVAFSDTMFTHLSRHLHGTTMARVDATT